MANRKISEFNSINGNEIDTQDILTLVHVFEVDPELRNRKITFTEFRAYLNQYYADVKIGQARTITNSTDTGTTGEICWDNDYIYVCVATNTWKRAGLSSW